MWSTEKDFLPQRYGKVNEFFIPLVHFLHQDLKQFTSVSYSKHSVEKLMLSASKVQSARSFLHVHFVGLGMHG
jgi:hypothetical protein